jgi:proteasome beta subunit
LENQIKTGTTTVGIVCKDCVVLAADMRATVGHMIMDTDVEKVNKVASHIALTISGGVAAAQLVIKHIKSQIKLHELRVQRTLNVKEVANMVAGWLNGLVRSGGIVHFLMGGYHEKTGPRLYDVFPDGSVIEKREYFSSGSGSIFALGVLDSEYKSDMTQAEGVALAEKAIQTAIKRDSASGNGLNVYVIDKEGVRKEYSKVVDSTFK